MRLPSRVLLGLCAAVLAVGLPSDARAQASPLVGAWNLTGTGPDSTYVYWLEVKEENGQLTGRFLNRVGSPGSLGIVKVDNGELVFQAGRPDRLTGPEYRARLEDGKLVGRHTMRSAASVNASRGRPFPGGYSEDHCLAHFEMSQWGKWGNGAMTQ